MTLSLVHGMDKVNGSERGDAHVPPIGDHHGQIAGLPGHPGLEAGIAQPSELIVDRIGKVVLAVNGRHRVSLLVRYHHVPENETSSGRQELVDPPEQFRLGGTVEVVDGQSGYHDLEGTRRERILQPPYPQLDT
jgi:hypothetical protein